LWVAPVPKRIAIAPHRWHITVTEGEQRWILPIQFTEIEARSLLPRLRGEPRERILAIVREMCDRGGAS
ncbi:MAG: hypothetical protein LH647_04000, partial [Leptolyngbyaceae cyanobacterium CAN_BIN12]|nr:hypothetical protein [Leptolyngbyaceae cyanobacterium CAN_BIN12]